MSERIVNLTGHDLNISGVLIKAERDRFPARCYERITDLGEFSGVPLVVKEYGRVVGLPDPRPGTIYVVSNIVRLAFPERDDLASPGRKMVDHRGNLLGAMNLVVNPSRLKRVQAAATQEVLGSDTLDEDD